MKKIIKAFSCILIVVSIACSDVDPGAGEPLNIVGTWELKEGIDGWTGRVTPATEFPFMEFYTFNTNGTFAKYRDDGSRAEGVYEVASDGDMEFFNLTFISGDITLAQSCSQGETLRWEDDNLRGGSNPCDGPDFVYSKVFNILE